MGRGRRIWWVLVFCRVAGDPPRVEKGGDGQELSRLRAVERERDFRRLQMRRGPTFPEPLMILSAFFQLCLLPEA